MECEVSHLMKSEREAGSLACPLCVSVNTLKSSERSRSCSRLPLPVHLHRCRHTLVRRRLFTAALTGSEVKAVEELVVSFPVSPRRCFSDCLQTLHICSD